jgi:isoleucyl-tRNA synthetase
MFSIKEIEEKILNFWKENKIFQKSLEKKAPKGEYIFYDGPPFATGTPHYGNLVASIMKDVVPRYWTMKGYHVARRWGWDCHGLPIENIVEKELGFKSKKEILDFGVDKFNETCRSKVLTYVEEWKKVINRLGRWADMENAYKTMDLNYMESVWWVFKQFWDKGLVYEGYKSLLICPRCETTLSQYEVAEGYQNIKDISVTVKFELVDEPGTYILAWTTTSWTLPGNVALAIGEDVDYVKFSLKGHSAISDGNYIVSRHDLGQYLISDEYKKDKKAGADVKVVQEFKGRELVGKKYKPLFPYYLDREIPNKENIYTIVSADFVSTEDGTGVVHIAPAYGEEDMVLGQKKKLPMIQNVGLDGRFYDEVKDFAGLNVKPIEDTKKTDRLIIEYLKKNNLLFSEEEFEHSYPHCWRCDTPLINYATASWFIKVLELKPKLLELAKEINWFPAHIKEGRFGKWLEGAYDWSISRQRFWASVIPIWQCECGETIVFGSVKELEEASGVKISDLHKHIIDKVEIPCKKCGKKMKRISDVLDTWFDSGSMPFAQEHYPFENKEKFDSNFPAQFIAEGVDQTRAWFYYLHVIATAIKEKISFQNVIVNGIVLAEDGKKMSKHLNNYTDPMEIMEKYGSDALRFYLLSSPVMAAENLNFSDKGIDEVYKKIILLLSNIYSFYQMYFADKNVPTRSEIMAKIASADPMDQWLIARLNNVTEEATKLLDKYGIVGTTRHIKDFIDEFSTWYLKLSRDRFKKGSGGEYFGFALFELSKLIAPFMPFISEHIYQNLKLVDKKESVHLENWTKENDLTIDPEVIKRMRLTQRAVEIGLALRASAGIKIRQPLNKISFKDKEMFKNIFVDLVKQELNVRDVVLGEEDKLDTEISGGLKEEGMLRELSRQINQLRKENNLSVKDKNVVLEYETKNRALAAIIQKFQKELKENCACAELAAASGLTAKELNIDGEKIKINLKKI